MRYNISAQDTEKFKTLRCGDLVLLTGYILTGRDSAHKRIANSLSHLHTLPFDIKDQLIYYTGPCPSPPNRVIGSCGPTTSSRMDSYTPALHDLGLKGSIGKGPRSISVINSIIKNKAIYFAATGGAGALFAECVKTSQIIAYEDLGPEAVHMLFVVDMPLIVAIDSLGKTIY